MGKNCLWFCSVLSSSSLVKTTTSFLDWSYPQDVEYAGLKFPHQINCPHAVTQVLLQEEGRLRRKDLKEGEQASTQVQGGQVYLIVRSYLPDPRIFTKHYNGMWHFGERKPGYNRNLATNGNPYVCRIVWPSIIINRSLLTPKSIWLCQRLAN